MNLRNKILFFSALFLSVLIFGCGSRSGVATLPNGKAYYIPEDCYRFRPLSNSYDVACYAKDNKYLRLLKPLTNEQLYAIKQSQLRNQTETRRAIDNFGKTVQQINEQNNVTFQNNMNMVNANNAAIGQMSSSFSTNQSSTNVYNVRQVGSNSYIVNSDSYRVNKEGSNRYRVYGPEGSSNVYQSTGPITTGSDGTKCIKTGNLYRCSK